MRKGEKHILLYNKLILTLCVFFFSALMSLSAENSLSSVNVKQVNNGEYNILLKLDNNVRIKKSFNGNDNLTLVLNKTLPSDSVEIVYDNAAGLKNVTVQKKNADNTIILLQGKNIVNSTIFTKELSTGIIKQSDLKDNIFVIHDTKLFVSSIIGVVSLFIIMLFARTSGRKKCKSLQNKRTIKSLTVNSVNSTKHNTSRYIPSINYGVNNTYNFSNSKMTVPEKFIINNYMNGEYSEEMRKIG